MRKSMRGRASPGILLELRPDTNQSFYTKNFPKIHSKISGMVI